MFINFHGLSSLLSTEPQTQPKSELFRKVKIPNNFTYEVEWTQELCTTALLETRLMPPSACLQTINQLENETFTSLNEWISKKGIAAPKMLITGTPRSGTTMFAALATSLGIRLSNDANAPTTLGTVSWAFAGPTSYYPLCPNPIPLNKTRPTKKPSQSALDDDDISAERRRNQLQKYLAPYPSYRFHYMFHQVRDPLSSIPSLTTVIPHWFRCKSQIIPITPNMNYSARVEHMALQIWVEWNSRIDRFPFIPLYRVEDFNLLDLLESVKHPTKIPERDYLCAYHNLEGHNSRANPNIAPQKITWHNVFAINHTLGTIALEMAYRYGYRYYRNGTLVRMTPRIRSNHSSISMNYKTYMKRTYQDPCKKVIFPPKKKPSSHDKAIEIKPIKYPSLTDAQMEDVFSHPIFI